MCMHTHGSWPSRIRHVHRNRGVFQPHGAHFCGGRRPMSPSGRLPDVLNGGVERERKDPFRNSANWVIRGLSAN